MYLNNLTKPPFNLDHDALQWVQRIKSNLTMRQKLQQLFVLQQIADDYLAGKNVKVGSDDTIYAMKDGTVNFSSKTKKLYDGSLRKAKIVSVK